MTSVPRALSEILSRAKPTTTVRLPLAEALGHVLRTAARADIDSPPFDASAMDGYALHQADAGRPLRVIGTSQAGRAFSGKVAAGECVRILTGAPVPAGTDGIAKQEDVTRTGDIVEIRRPDPADYIRRRGENRRAGDIVVPAGSMLGAPELAALASAGIAQPEVAAAPRCAHLVTGDELVPPDHSPVGAQIRDSNSTLIAALLRRHGADPVARAHAKDDLAAARAVVAAMPTHDVLLISGGAGAGDRDLARPLLADLGYELHFEKVDLRPGRPLVFASRGTALAFVLPGNPVSHWVVFQLFLAPLLEFLQTGATPVPVRLTGRLARDGRMPKPDGRPTYWPSRVTVVEGGHVVQPLAIASSGDSSGLVGANALLPVPADADRLEPGQPVEFIPCS